MVDTVDIEKLKDKKEPKDRKEYAKQYYLNNKDKIKETSNNRYRSTHDVKDKVVNKVENYSDSKEYHKLYMRQILEDARKYREQTKTK